MINNGMLLQMSRDRGRTWTSVSLKKCKVTITAKVRRDLDRGWTIKDMTASRPPKSPFLLVRRWDHMERLAASARQFGSINQVPRESNMAVRHVR